MNKMVTAEYNAAIYLQGFIALFKQLFASPKRLIPS